MRTTSLLLAGLLVLALAPAARAGEALATFDLTYTLRLDREDPQQRRRIWDETHCVAALQGLANRADPRLYVFLVGGPHGETDRFWFDHLRAPQEWLAGRTVQAEPDLPSLVARFRSEIAGVVAYDEHVMATSNVATTVAGAERLLPVRYDAAAGSLYRFLTDDPHGPRLPVKVWLVNRDGSSLFTGAGTLPGSATPSSGSAKCDAYLWAKERYLDTGKCDATVLGYYLDAYWLRQPAGDICNHTLENHDYIVARKGFAFDLSPWDDEVPVDDPGQPPGTDARTLQAILRSAYEQVQGRRMIHVSGFLPWDKKYTTHAGGKHEDVPGEWRYAEIISCFNGYMDADALSLGCMANASLFSHYPLAARYPQKLPTLADLRQRGLVGADGAVAKKRFATIYVGDYDSASWLYRRMPEIWNDPARGSVPLGWAFNPNLGDRMGPALAWARRTATANDVFISGDSGAGYLNPGALQPPRRWSGLPSGLAAWQQHCTAYYARWDISLTGFVIDGFAPAMDGATLDAYARFSPGGVVAQKIEPRFLHQGVPFLRMGPDLDHGDLDKAVDQVLAGVGSDAPDFHIFRTILWTPSEHQRLFNAVRAKARDVEFVDPYTLFLLLKTALAK
jgi:hypothetical protein